MRSPPPLSLLSELWQASNPPLTLVLSLYSKSLQGRVSLISGFYSSFTVSLPPATAPGLKKELGKRQLELTKSLFFPKFFLQQAHAVFEVRIKFGPLKKVQKSFGGSFLPTNTPESIPLTSRVAATPRMDTACREVARQAKRNGSSFWRVSTSLRI